MAFIRPNWADLAAAPNNNNIAINVITFGLISCAKEKIIA